MAVRNAQGECWCYQADWQVVRRYALGHSGLNCCHLSLDTEIALTVTEVAKYSPHRIVDPQDVLTEEGGRTHPLHVAARI